MTSSKQAREVWKRIRHLIDKYEGGNVSSAARALGVSQRGLHKIYVGETTDPHISIIMAIAARYCRAPYHVDPHWLLLGAPSPITEAKVRDMLQALLDPSGPSKRGKSGPFARAALANAR